MSRNIDITPYKEMIEQTDSYEYGGKVSQVVGLTVEAEGLTVKMGDVCRIYTTPNGDYTLSEVVGFKDNKVLLMPFGDLSGVGPNNVVISTNRPLMVPVGWNFLGRTLDALGRPMDGLGPIRADAQYSITNEPPNPITRKRIHEILPLGIKALDGLLTIGRGQRVGIFAGSGVGKSTLLGMIARNALADINVITLVGERGREVRDFIERDLGEEGLARSVLVIATSDQPALLRIKAAQVGTSIAEYFRDQGHDVLLLMDSLTRFSMAQREIGMATGEPPVSRGYTPSVFSILPQLLERSGTSDKGSITGLYTVLVEGDDMNEPIADTVRGILDGHIVLSRRLAHSNHYPAIDILQSISRLMSEIAPEEQKEAAGFIKNIMATYSEAQDLISIGAYRAGSNRNIDLAIALIDQVNEFLRQRVGENYSLAETQQLMQDIYERRNEA
ncbi:flagellar protein export ATPase FliI [Eubacteriales bacterium OttesenSCG-928-N14]|nr:flagellar protein export ATPase FliI [Eubacteriales bacterium OttesenSCG-928-N14]